MHPSFRTERPQDYAAVEQLVAAAFRDEVYSDQNEQRRGIGGCTIEDAQREGGLAGIAGRMIYPAAVYQDQEG